MSADSYAEFLNRKAQLGGDHGFEAEFLPDFLFPFQEHLVRWAVRKGRAAIFADCGLGKSPMELVWAKNVVEETGKPVLILAPLGVSRQFVTEAEKFGLECAASRTGKIESPVIVTNYERLHYFRPETFGGVVCDESSILKNSEGKTRAAVTEFLRTIPFRLLGTATAAPNDYPELGTSSEALGQLGHRDMLTRFFKEDGQFFRRSQLRPDRETRQGNGKWRFRGHAERDFWRWVCSWARAVRRPSDIGFSDDGFELPPLEMVEHVVEARSKASGLLFSLPAFTLDEQREERRRTLKERCEKAAALAIAETGPSLVWCHLNQEAELLEKLIPGAVQVSGSDTDERAEEKIGAFLDGKVKKLISKPQILGFGLNFQHCAHQTWFPSHSFEQLYQGIRRSWRFGQTRPVRVDVVTSEGESRVLANLRRKAAAAEAIFERLVALMNEELRIERAQEASTEPEIPAWLS